MSKEYNLVSIQKFVDKLSGSDLYPQFLLQIQKDLNRSGIDYNIKNSKPKDLFREIQSLLVEKLQYSFNEYVSFLYAVDVSENEVRKGNLEDIQDIAEYATYLILKREWQKVWYRNNMNP
ncbi:hypothetical protein [Aquimarina sp. MMG016]|uniref:hypothetical protein n=1 Tax=Aquimarina sp. MMG016 TaxID=2822690 RepID=UPI001B3A4A39|nr:hypothetical protein [Aquimarina sp. MMG016]MBQ4818811.1 hypothetical protein [Aquimarina sp. MMG016]